MNIKLTKYDEPWVLWVADGAIVQTQMGSRPATPDHTRVLTVYPNVDMEFLCTLLADEQISDLANPDYVAKVFSQRVASCRDELYPEHPDTYPGADPLPTVTELANGLYAALDDMAAIESNYHRAVSEKKAEIATLQRQLKACCDPSRAYLVEIQGSPMAIDFDTWGQAVFHPLTRGD